MDPYMDVKIFSQGKYFLYTHILRLPLPYHPPLLPTPPPSLIYLPSFKYPYSNPSPPSHLLHLTYTGEGPVNTLGAFYPSPPPPSLILAHPPTFFILHTQGKDLSIPSVLFIFTMMLWSIQHHPTRRPPLVVKMSQLKLNYLSSNGVFLSPHHRMLLRHRC